MPVKEINKTMYECTCARSECYYHTHPWLTATVPARCPSCKSRRWNRPVRLSALPPITYNGVTLTRSGWAKKLGISKTAIRWRINQGWPMEQVLSTEDWRVQK